MNEYVQLIVVGAGSFMSLYLAIKLKKRKD